MNLNKVTLLGNLTADPKSSTIPSGQSVTSFTLATNYQWRDVQTKQMKETVEFHNIVAWRKNGELAAKYLKKGDRIYLEGRLQTRSWADKSGAKRSRTEIITDHIIMLGGRAKAKAEANQAVEESVTLENVPA